MFRRKEGRKEGRKEEKKEGSPGEQGKMGTSFIGQPNMGEGKNMKG